MFEGYGHPYGINSALVGAATNTSGRTGIWASIEHAKQLAIYGLEFSLLMRWDLGEEACLDPDEVPQAAERDCL